MSTFISYSRVNSAFVVRLARDLKSAGFEVWLDQLDIPKGARWDDEIEIAVEKATIFMVVLAPESMESQNVKDELSYAIDSGKFILPVVIKPCKIPLRLRRFQYVDFSDKPYKDSLADIKHLLSNMMQNTRPLPVPVEQPPVIEPADAFVSFNDAMVQREMLTHPDPVVSEKREGLPDLQSLRRKAIPLAVLIAAIGIAAIAVFAVSAARGRNTSSPPPVVDSSSTATLEEPTETATITPTPLPAQVTDPYGVTMMLVSAGEFMMGSDGGSAEEGPAQKLFLRDFYIDKYEVTNASYKTCVDAGKCDPPKKDASRTHPGYFSKPDYRNYPVVYVTWDMANEYCSWRGARLPTEAEWEKAARGPDGTIYPWGNDASCDQANFAGCGKDTAPANSFDGGQSVYKVLDMSGNVSEWVNSLYAAYPYDSAREDPMASGERVIRGGSFADKDNQVSAISRQKADPATSKDNIGFRCVGMPNGNLGASTLVTVTPTSNPTEAASGNGKTKERLTATATASTQVLPVNSLLTPTDTPTPTSTELPTATPTSASPTPTATAASPTATPTDNVQTPQITPTDNGQPSQPTPTDTQPAPTESKPPTPTDQPPTPTDQPPTPTDQPAQPAQQVNPTAQPTPSDGTPTQ